MARLLCKYLESRMETWRLETPGREREREKGNHAKIRRQQILDTRVLFDRSVENNGDGDVITWSGRVDEQRRRTTFHWPALDGNRNKNYYVIL